VAWCLHMAECHPCLTCVLRTMLDELKLGEQWDVCRVEEESQICAPSQPIHHPVPNAKHLPPFTYHTSRQGSHLPRLPMRTQVCCDWLKDLVGIMITKGAVPRTAALQGFFDDALLKANGETSTGFPPVPVVCTNVLATWASHTGEKRVRLANVTPCEPNLDIYTKQGALASDVYSATTEHGERFPKESSKVQQAKKMVRLAKEMRDEAILAKVQSALRATWRANRPLCHGVRTGLCAQCTL
jgi:hypothetical protein